MARGAKGANFPGFRERGKAKKIGRRLCEPSCQCFGPLGCLHFASPDHAIFTTTRHKQFASRQCPVDFHYGNSWLKPHIFKVRATLVLVHLGHHATYTCTMPFFTMPTSFGNANFMQRLSSIDIPAVGLTSQSSSYQTKLSLAMANQPLPPHSSHPALPHLILLVFEAVLEIVCVSLPGYIVARQGMFNAEMQKFAANLNVTIFTPCLSKCYVFVKNTANLGAVFTKLASQLTTDTLIDLAIIPLIFLVQTLVSFLCSLSVSKAFRFSKRPRNFVIAMGVGQLSLLHRSIHAKHAAGLW